MPLFPQGILLQPDSIDNTLLSNMAQGTVKGRALGAGLGDPQDLTLAQLQAMVGLSYRNILGRNGGFEVWQRGAGGTAGFNIATGGAQYTADGWHMQCNTNQASTVFQTGGLTAGSASLSQGQSRFSAFVVRSSGSTGVGAMTLHYPLDADEIVLMRGKVVTLSFLAMKNPAFTAPNVQAVLYIGTGAPAKRGFNPYTGEAIAISIIVSLTATATLFSATSSAVIPVNTTQAAVEFVWNPAGTAPANDGWLPDDVQLEVGSIATPFERRPFEQELLGCQRHYQKSFRYAIAPAQNVDPYSNPLTFSQAVGAGVNCYGPQATLVPTMRDAPTVTLYNPYAPNAQIRCANSNTDCTGSTVWWTSERSFQVFFSTATGSAPGYGNSVAWTADAGIV